MTLEGGPTPLLAKSGNKAVSGGVVPNLSQETLAEMVGTTRSRVSKFMNRFRKLDLIHYGTGDDLHVHSALLRAVLRDDNAMGSLGEHNSTDQVKKILPTRSEEEQKHIANRREQRRVFRSAA